MAIHFFNEESKYKLKLKSELKQWIKAVAAEEGFKIAALNYILCSDEYLHQINVTYLQHDTFTDIITFDHSEKKDSIAGDIFLSTDRVIENAQSFKVSESEEMCRVLVHGALHLMGYTDKSKATKLTMTTKENYYLAKESSMENKTALIIGATGLVGKFCLSYLLNENAYARVIAISRKPIGFPHAKLENIVCDFDQLEKHQAEINADDIYCCLGTTIAVAGSREAFTKVDYTYPLQVAEMAKQNGASQFLLVSALGADKNSKIFYSKVKGELQEAIQKLNFNSTYIFQPSFLKGFRKEFRLGEKIALILLPFFEIMMLGPLKKYKSIDAMVVANAMYLKAQSGSAGLEILSSDQIQQLWKKK